MNAPRRLSLVVAVVNGVGFIGYLVWLADRGRRVFFDPQGVMDLLPCIAFLFVFACLAWQARRGGAGSRATPGHGGTKPKHEIGMTNDETNSN